MVGHAGGIRGLAGAGEAGDQRSDAGVADREDDPAHGVGGDDHRRAGGRGHQAGQRRADHQAELIGQPEHRVARHSLLGREQVRDQRVLARHAPGAEQGRDTEQGDIAGRAE